MNPPMNELIETATKANSELDLARGCMKLLIGKQVIEIFSQPRYKNDWNLLYNSCSWATAFQSWSFVFPWYSMFQDRFVPVVVVSTDQKGSLSGILPMAIPVEDFEQGSKVKIVGAGEYESEYQAWISSEFNSKAFIESALSVLIKKFPGSDIIFRFIPSPNLLDWVEKSPGWKNKAIIQSFKRPLMRTQSPTIGSVISIQRQFKTKYNRLKKLGALSFERVTEIERFSVVLEELMVQFDFRQGAMFNKNQFRDNPMRKDFLLELFRQKILHVTVLLVNEKIIASLAAVSDRRWVHLQGLNTHSPFYSRYSPGILHFYLLGKSLVEEDHTEVFDLTPGGDHYKERWATDHDTVYTLTLASGRRYRIKRSLKKMIHGWLVKAGQRPMTVELLLEKKMYLLKKKGLKSLIRPRSGSEELYQVNQLPNDVPSRIPTVNKNSLNDLLDYEDSLGNLTRWEFMENAMIYLGEGKNVYTLSDGKKLLACVWETITLPKTTAGDLSPSLPEKSNMLFNLYCHSNFSDNLVEFLYSVISFINNDRPDKVVYIQVNPRQIFFSQALEAVGFTIV